MKKITSLLAVLFTAIVTITNVTVEYGSNAYSAVVTELENGIQSFELGFHSLLTSVLGTVSLNAYRIGNPIADMQKISDPEFVKKNFIHYLIMAGVFANRAEAQKAIANKVVADFSYFDARTVAAVTTADFFEGTVSATSHTNLLDYSLPKNEHALVFSVSAFEGVNAAVNATVWTAGLSAASLINGWFSVSSNDTLMLKKFPLSSFISAAEDAQAGQLFLSKPIVYEAQQEFSMPIKLPTVGVVNQNLMLKVNGLALI